MRVDLSRPGLHDIPAWRGTFRVEAVEEGGVPVSDAAALELRARAPGDRFQAGPGADGPQDAPGGATGGPGAAGATGAPGASNAGPSAGGADDVVDAEIVEDDKK